MTEPLSEQQLAEIRARAEAATAGPWCADSWEIYQGASDDVPHLAKWIGETCRAGEEDGSRADADFIAHARVDVPALLAEVERSRKAPFPGSCVWRLWGEDGTSRDFYASEDDAKTASIAWYEADEGVCPEYSWPRHEDGSRELVAGGERTGIYLTPAVVRGGKPGQVLPWVDDLTNIGASDLVSELAEVFLDFYRPDGGSDADLLATARGLLETHRDRLARELAQDAAGAGERP